MFKIKQLICACIIISHFFSFSAYAAQNPGLGISVAEEHGGTLKGNEFVSGASRGQVLMRINLWGAMNKSGVHHIPTRTDLVTLFSFAGGPMHDADLSDIMIKRKMNDKEESIAVDMNDIIASKKPSPMLEPNDIIVVPASKPLVSNNVILGVTLLSGILSIVIASIVVHDRVRYQK
ncbi:MAG: hypothetical protein A2583_03730 [Bdellovibrionales bacterium RIFOXYD1_FULL_53_11]|nr:MAG: hypothetical protein A2583_03730 [Bdellovibrionales bacterium RIFOXYD1_FULL_53_11]